MTGPPKILLCLTGSVAVVKSSQLAVKLSEFAEVQFQTFKRFVIYITLVWNV